jgi:TolB-like protein
MPASCDRPLTRLARRALGPAVLLGLVAALTPSGQMPQATAQPRTPYVNVAVLEFRIDPEYKEEMVALLSEMQAALIAAVQEGSDLKMPARDKVKEQKGNRDLLAAGRALNVQAVVACEVKPMGDHKDAITCRVVDVATGQELYSRTLTWGATLNDTRAVKDGYARVLAADVKSRLTGPPHAAALDADALADKVMKKLEPQLRDIVRRELIEQLRQHSLAESARLRTDFAELSKKLRDDLVGEVRKAVADARGPGVGDGRPDVALLEWTVDAGYLAEFKTLVGEMYQALGDELTAGGVRLASHQAVKGVVGKDPRAAGKELGVRVVVTGAVAPFEDKDSLLIKMIDVDSGAELVNKRLSWEATLETTKAVKGKYAKEMATAIKGKLPARGPARPDEKPAPGGPPDSVAVLPLPLGDGLDDAVKGKLKAWADDVPALLLKDGRLRVTPPQRVKELRPLPPREAGKALGVRAVLVAKVSVEGKFAVLEAELIEVETDMLLWKDRIEIAKGPNDVEVLETAAAAAVKKRLTSEK